jgi:hypothetical protein
MERETIDGVVNVIVELAILRNSLVVSIAKDCGGSVCKGTERSSAWGVQYIRIGNSIRGRFSAGRWDECMVDSSYTGSCRHSLEYLPIPT